LPLSKENLIENLERVRNKPRALIDKDLSEFEKTFSEYVEIEQGNYSYHTATTTRNHPPSRNPCPNPSDSPKSYVLKPSIIDQSDKELASISVDLECILNRTLSNIETTEDLLYLSVLENICQICKSGAAYCFGTAESGNTESIKAMMEEAEIDTEFISYFLESAYKRFSLTLGKLKEFLPSESKIYSIFYSHKFNTSSCYRIVNIIIRRDVAQYMYNKLCAMHLDSLLGNNYHDIRKDFMAQEERLPLFEYRSELLRFLVKYHRELTNGKLYGFVIEGRFDKALEYLMDKGIVKVESGIVILLSSDKLEAIYRTLKEEEDDRILKNKEEFRYRWLRSESGIKPSREAD